MASLIKNQIIKRLSKFVKNLSANQINLSTIKGEGELSSINLDERALEDVTELPTWLKIQKATCGRVFIKIPWTNLKTLPIQLTLDDVIIEIETCEKLRDLQSSSNGNDPFIGKYGFTNRVIDGISLTITNLTFTIKSQGFKASVFLPCLDIYSTTPNGQKVDTLTLTRLRNTTKSHILLFKEISWPNARIEASSNDNNFPGTSIRFIVNSCRMRIAMKKNLQDSTMITSRVMTHFDDLLSVLNDAQLKSALNTYKEITELMNRASEQRKHYAEDKFNGNLADLIEMTHWKGNDVLYIGDHIYGDLADLFLKYGWRTGAILEEVEEEINIINSESFQKTIQWLNVLQWLINHLQIIPGPEADALMKTWVAEREDEKAKSRDLFNPYFGSVFRTHTVPTYFHRRLARFADVYTSNVCNFLSYPLDYIFFPRRVALAHENVLPTPDINLLLMDTAHHAMRFETAHVQYEK
ncbi:unnamed protein product [Rotaria sordida]|uniref:Chorein N-terminal domain-containing protein n=1 Tax=Rotaria sordida TaxID=392033 RepID=A0A814L1S6_9BILA|nr:unnamed protein product [Rotaria sordida]